ncbi:hypothetical protein [uncultured Eubacterium sp.]|uniref:hypothetical protein n=1 Tax=uncultured Eubacterium sp. TaxID=165185 RepID=UPI002676FDFE|nr:hypothetical protein [uncultured Eubacterium sp.]
MKAKGKWIGIKVDGYVGVCPTYKEFKCSECGWKHNGTNDTLSNFCPNCGADMRNRKNTDERNEELLHAASWIDGYMKGNRSRLTIVDERAFYIAIRELVELTDDEYKATKEYVPALIKSESDWIRYQSPIPVEKNQ